jgi:hypothetical protein
MKDLSVVIFIFVLVVVKTSLSASGAPFVTGFWVPHLSSLTSHLSSLIIPNHFLETTTQQQHLTNDTYSTFAKSVAPGHNNFHMSIQCISASNDYQMFQKAGNFVQHQVPIYKP